MRSDFSQVNAAAILVCIEPTLYMNHAGRADMKPYCISTTEFIRKPNHLLHRGFPESAEKLGNLGAGPDFQVRRVFRG